MIHRIIANNMWNTFKYNLNDSKYKNHLIKQNINRHNKIKNYVFNYLLINNHIINHHKNIVNLVIINYYK